MAIRPPPNFTVSEAASVLDPLIAPSALRALVDALCLAPAGQRHTGRPGHPERTFPIDELMRLHAAVAPFLVAYPQPGSIPSAASDPPPGIRERAAGDPAAGDLFGPAASAWVVTEPLG